jgi:hypothetical protein
VKELLYQQQLVTSGESFMPCHAEQNERLWNCTVFRRDHLSRRFGSNPLRLIAILLSLACTGTVVSQTAPVTQTFTLSSLSLVNVNADAVDYKGRKAIRITKGTSAGGFALLRGTDFQDGTIEADVALKVTTPPGVRMPGFAGIAFRARADASHYELFYLRPGNSNSDDQAMRNHSVQYSAEPNFGWYQLRRDWPMVYESYAKLEPETWTRVKIEVKGRSARLYLDGASEASLVVDGLKGTDLRGGIALWGFEGEEAYFSNVRITPAAPQSLKNGSDASGTWQVHFPSDYGVYDGVLQLIRNGTDVTGTWSGGLGERRPVRGTWRDGYVELGFDAEWQTGDTNTVKAVMAGWIDNNSASGRMSIRGKADGPWTAKRTQVP